MQETPEIPPNRLDCQDVLDSLYLFVCEELEPSESLAIEAHIAACLECQKALGEHKKLSKSLPSGFQRRKLFYYSENN